MPTKRNTIIAIAKGIAIILVVAGHAEGPEWLTNFIYEFHMPLFFMAAGFSSTGNICLIRGLLSPGVSKGCICLF